MRYPIDRFRAEIAADDVYLVGGPGLPNDVNEHTAAFLKRLQRDSAGRPCRGKAKAAIAKPSGMTASKRMLEFFCDGFDPATTTGR